MFPVAESSIIVEELHSSHWWPWSLLRHTSKDYALARHHLQIASECVTLELICYLGDLYYYVYGVVKDETEAVGLFQLAADKHYPRAYYELGWCYFYGSGVLDEDER